MAIDDLPNTTPPRVTAGALRARRHRRAGGTHDGGTGGPNRARVSTPSAAKGNPRRYRWARTRLGRLRNLLAADATATAHHPRRAPTLPRLAFLDEPFSEKD
jgi:hypothetical protein